MLPPNPVPSLSMLKKASPVNAQAFNFFQLAKMKKFVSKRIIEWILSSVKREKRGKRVPCCRASTRLLSHHPEEQDASISL